MIRPTYRHERGFTAVELLIVSVLVAVLAAIAFPGFQAQLMRSQRADARSALLRTQATQERFFVQHNRYARDLQAPPPGGLGLHAVSENGFYSLENETSGEDDAGGFTVTARARTGSRQAQDHQCAVFSIDHLGQRHATDAHGNDRTAECWR